MKSLIMRDAGALHQLALQESSIRRLQGAYLTADQGLISINVQMPSVCWRGSNDKCLLVVEQNLSYSLLDGREETVPLWPELSARNRR